MKWLLIGILLLPIAGAAYALYLKHVGNPRVAEELRANPDGERAAKVMLLTLPDDQSIPVNYLREDRMVYAGADGRWWRQLIDDGARVEVLIRGERLAGHARAVQDDPEHVLDVFKRLRPTSYRWLRGVLVEIRLDPPSGSQ